MNTTTELTLSGRTPLDLRLYFEALQDKIYSELHKTLYRMQSEHIEAAIVLHEDFYFTHPGFKQNMVLTAISVGGDKNSVMLYFTDTMLGVEEWKYAMQDVEIKELLLLHETLLTVLK